MVETRELVAILAADVVGYSRLAGSDEDRILARLRRFAAISLTLLSPSITAVWSSAPAMMPSSVPQRSRRRALRRRSTERHGRAQCRPSAGRRIEFRMGIHLGDVVEENDGDLMGDSVNIAARLEGIAKPGSIFLSDDACRQVKSRPRDPFSGFWYGYLGLAEFCRGRLDAAIEQFKRAVSFRDTRPILPIPCWRELRPRRGTTPRRNWLWRRRVVSTPELTIKWLLTETPTPSIVIDGLRMAGLPE